MANLLGQNIGTNYKGILNLNTLNGNLSGTLQAVTDGDGNASLLQLSTTQVNVAGALTTQSQYVVNNLRVGGKLYFGNFKSNITNNGDNDLLLKNAAETSFGLLQFGGTTNAFPAIKRNAAALEVRLADDTGFATLQASQFTSNLLVGTTSGRMDIRGQYDISIAGGFTGGLGGVAISQGSSATPAATAILDVSSTTKGFLPPRMTTAERDLIVTPAAGLVIYNTSTGVLNFHNGSVWGAV